MGETAGTDRAGSVVAPPDPGRADPRLVLKDARAALGRGEWRLALELLDAVEPDVAGGSEAGTEALELRADALYGDGRFEASVAVWEQLHTRFAAQGRPDEAARAAAMVALYLMIDSGLMAPVRGWLRRAERCMAGRDVPACALVALVRTYERFMCGDMAAARDQAASAIELGERFGVVPAVVIGRVAGARVRIFDGDLEGGLDQLDEVATLLMSGEVDPLTTGMMFCELVCASQGLALHDRASEWTQVMDRWRPGAAIGGISGRCRVHRAEILRMSGPCDLAEQEALGACEELRPWMRREFGWPLVELGTIRLRKGDLAGAEEAFLAAHQLAWSPQPGLALLRLAQGDLEAAAALVADAIAHPFDIPSKERPPFGDLRLAPLLDAQVEIAAAAGDVDTARRAADALGKIAASYPTQGLQAAATLADARAALIAGDVERAIHHGVAAVAAWAGIGAPFEAAMARMVLAEARQRAGDLDGARLERQVAQTAFERFGAAGWAERAARLVETQTTPTPPAPTAPPAPPAPVTATFARSGDTRTVAFGDLTVVVRDLKGSRYLERLLAQPGREFHVLDLVAVECGTLPVASVASRGDGLAEGAGAGLPFLDDGARDAYRRRLADVDDDIDDALAANDVARLALARRDREFLVAELARAVGLRGYQRTAGGTAERARTSVTRSIRYALARLSAHHPVLAAHLERCVRTGTYCSYQPDPLAAIDWAL